ncbi:uncharacterized protein [Nicotiana tomentosiformis]|uniref:uncharacterized protein n=1 Tax=Nicotiana tomentosiformis TaxID=4098 RepID=UPI00388C70EC
MGVAEMSGVSFTTFQPRGEAYQWWRAYELSSQDEEASLTWTQFSDMFLREYVPQSLRDSWCVEFEQLLQDAMNVSEYAGPKSYNFWRWRDAEIDQRSKFIIPKLVEKVGELESALELYESVEKPRGKNKRKGI